VADAGDELTHRHQHAGEAVDALGGDLAARVWRELELVERHADQRALGVGGVTVVTSNRAGEGISGTVT
jgi:hypothetical protein